jgi:hypothetical protein
MTKSASKFVCVDTEKVSDESSILPADQMAIKNMAQAMLSSMHEILKPHISSENITDYSRVSTLVVSTLVTVMAQVQENLILSMQCEADRKKEELENLSGYLMKGLESTKAWVSNQIDNQAISTESVAEDLADQKPTLH